MCSGPTIHSYYHRVALAIGLCYVVLGLGLAAVNIVHITEEAVWRHASMGFWGGFVVFSLGLVTLFSSFNRTNGMIWMHLIMAVIAFFTVCGVIIVSALGIEESNDRAKASTITTDLKNKSIAYFISYIAMAAITFILTIVSFRITTPSICCREKGYGMPPYGYGYGGGGYGGGYGGGGYGGGYGGPYGMMGGQQQPAYMGPQSYMGYPTYNSAYNMSGTLGMGVGMGGYPNMQQQASYGYPYKMAKQVPAIGYM